MSTREAVAPVHVVNCDTPGCHSEFTPGHPYDKRSANRARLAARVAGWQVRPFSGTGSRTAPDRCPRHAEVTR